MKVALRCQAENSNSCQKLSCFDEIVRFFRNRDGQHNREAMQVRNSAAFFEIGRLLQTESFPLPVNPLDEKNLEPASGVGWFFSWQAPMRSGAACEPREGYPVESSTREPSPPGGISGRTGCPLGRKQSCPSPER
jgi:hypothetical protein